MYETSTAAARRPVALAGGRPRPASSTFVVVQEAPQRELDTDLQRIQVSGDGDGDRRPLPSPCWCCISARALRLYSSR